MTKEESENGEGSISKHTPIIKIWMKYIFAQKFISAGTWFWSCRHPNLDFQGVEGKGVMISSHTAVDEEMEIQWIKMTASN